ncbi:ATP-binding protein [Nonomuraea rubra]|uniref:ATP-binding protein n=1 Tax=Nonomuraea rubra TaxID=46180 RepID=UPI00361EE64C
MIGRNAEIAVLSRMIAESRGGQGNAVALYGVAGIGKSALLEEAASRAGNTRSSCAPPASRPSPSCRTPRCISCCARPAT